MTFCLVCDFSESLQLVAIYGLISCLALLVLGNSLGWLVDCLARHKMVSLAVITQNTAVCLTCLVMTIYFSVGFILYTQTHSSVFLCSILVSSE